MSWRGKFRLVSTARFRSRCGVFPIWPRRTWRKCRRTLENELRGRGIAIVENAGVDEIRVTLSQNISGYLLVAEIKRGEERATILVPWAHSAGSVRADTGTVAVEKTLLLAQPDPILDLAKVDADLLILQPGRVARFGMESGRWVAKEAAPLTPLVLPRDARGRLVLQGGAYLAYLPGTICSGAVAPLDARCREAEEAWPLSREPSLRAFVARGKNSFDGRINAAGLGKSVPPFYAAAAVQEASGRLWLFTRLDGRAYLHDSSLEPVAPLGGWGSDIAGVNCGSEQPGAGHAAGRQRRKGYGARLSDREPAGGGASARRRASGSGNGSLDRR